jgi:2-dehydro-3-deoxyphosphogluconate aldolase/(4S)-4-hydroxy-2-oxoglutarate aldolase
MDNQSRQSWLAVVQQQRAIAVIRTLDPKVGIQLATAVAMGGMRLIEITWNSEQPAALIAKLRQELPDCTIGAGTILDRDQLDTAIAAGAEFVFTPHVDVNLIQRAIACDIPIIPGALSPTEIVQAWHTGASSVKVFPISLLGGVAYIRSLQAPLGHIPLIPTGGVTLETAPGLIAAGAVAVGLSSALFPQAWVQRGNWDAIAAQTAQLVDRLNAAHL